MANKPKAKGTSFETQCVTYLRARLGDGRIERRALHGNNDMGDIHNLFAHGHEGVVECKNYREWGPADLAKWKSQTVDERGNADADFALLVVHRDGCGKARFGENHCYMQVRDLEKVIGGEFSCLYGDSSKDMWVCVTVDDACKMMLGEHDEA